MSIHSYFGPPYPHPNTLAGFGNTFLLAFIALVTLERTCLRTMGEPGSHERLRLFEYFGDRGRGSDPHKTVLQPTCDSPATVTTVLRMR